MLFSSHPETIDTFSRHYRPKLVLFFILALITRAPTHLPLPPAITSAVPPTPSVSNAHPNSPNHHPITVGTRSDHKDATIDVREPPMTPAWKRGAGGVGAGAGSEESTTEEKRVTMPVKGSTSQDANSSSWAPTTPPLSEPPRPSRAASPFIKAKRIVEELQRQEEEKERKATGVVETVSGEVEGGADDTTLEPSPTDNIDDEDATPLPSPSDCPIDFRGRPMCPNETRIPPSLRARSSELADAASEFGVWVLDTFHSLALSLLRVRLSAYFLTLLVMHLLLGVQLLSLVLEDGIVKTGLANPLPPDFRRGGTLGKRWSRMKWRAKATGQRYWAQLIGIAVLAVVVGVVGKECWMEGEQGRDVPFGRWALPKLVVEEGSTGVNEKNFTAMKRLLKLESVAAALSLIQPIKHILPSSILPPTIAPSSFFTSSTPQHIASRPFFRQARIPPTVELDSVWLISLFIDGYTSVLTILQFLALTVALHSYSPFSVSPHLLFHAVNGRWNHIAGLRTNHAGCLVHWFHFQSFCPVCHVPVIPATPSTDDDVAPLQNPPAPFGVPQLGPLRVNEYPGNVRRRAWAH
ncbi:hypothetical protein MNV49_002055 [Pseudohyphozyma bogoriensis]|nr:hypothetical protein MNV49_002055 [Pseudohyphozyma bogoriensis]